MEELGKTLETVKQEDVKGILEVIKKIPDLGTVGIIAGIVLILLSIGVWWWWNDIGKKLKHKQTQEGREKDKADGVKDNQQGQSEWDEAQDKIDAVRGDDEKEDPPPRPK